MVELMVAVVLVAILAAISTPVFSGMMRRADARQTARALANKFRQARNQAMSRGEVVLANIDTSTDNGTVQLLRSNNNTTNCANVNGTQAIGHDTDSDGTPDSAAAIVGRMSGNLKLHNTAKRASGGRPTTLCFSPDGQVLDQNGQIIYDQNCDGKNFRMWIADEDAAGNISSIHTDCQTSQSNRIKQDNERALINFWEIEVPYNGAIQASQ